MSDAEPKPGRTPEATVISAPLVLAGIAALLALVVFLATVDIAFDYFSRFSLRTFREESWKTEYLDQALDDPMRFLVPLRIGLQGGLIALTVLVTTLYLSSESPQPLLAAFGTMVALFLFFRELVPHVVGRKNPEKVLLALLPAFRLYAKCVHIVSRPVTLLLNLLAPRVDDETVTDEDVQAFIEAGEDEGILEGDEGKMVQSIVGLGDSVVREIMTPRPEMVAVPEEATLRDLRRLFAEEKYARVPVYRENLDQVVGLAYAIDLLSYLDEHPDASLDESIAPLIREVAFVPENKKVAELLDDFQSRNQTFSMVVDEYGGISGLLTVEDILEEIVGEIHDEFDEVDEEIVKETEGVFLVSGRADIEDVSEELELELDADVNGSGFETVSGYVLHALGRIPESGEVLERGGLRIEVVDADGQRINKVRLHLPAADGA
jgi:CBS domain containing-hemolysin-like protein